MTEDYIRLLADLNEMPESEISHLALAYLPPGRDHGSKPDLIERLISHLPREGLEAIINSFRASHTSALPEVMEQIKPAKKARKSPSPKTSLERALSEAVRDSLESVIQQDELIELIKAEIRKLPPYAINIQLNNEPLNEIQGYARPELSEALTLAMHRLNILMVGPAGCGKTYIARQVAGAMNLRFGSISCSAGMSESHLTGWLLPRGEAGRFEYVQSVFVDIYENGGVFLFDEMDAADSNTLLFVNQALANGGFFMPQRYEQPEVKKHPDCIIMAAANTYGTGGSIAYAGRERLDEATLDRFRAGVIEVGYDNNLEDALCDTDVLTWGRRIRAKIAETKLQRVMSTRFLIDASKLKRSGSPLSKIESTYFHGWREDERRKVAA